MKYPENLKYTKEHEWAKIEGNTATIGITQHAQNSLGDIVFVELPPIGKELKFHDTFGVVESIKAVSDLYSPLTGKVIATNSSVIAEPSLLNRSPHDEAWLIKLELTQATQDSLMSADQYMQFIEKL